MPAAEALGGAIAMDIGLGNKIDNLKSIEKLLQLEDTIGYTEIRSCEDFENTHSVFLKASSKRDKLNKKNTFLFEKVFFSNV